MMTVLAGLRLRLQLSTFLFLHRDKEWFSACKRVHDFLDGYIDTTYKQLARDQTEGISTTEESGESRDDLLWTIAGQVPDPIELRTQLLGVWIPSNDTTSILMSNTIWALARHPQAVQKLRQEVLLHTEPELISFEQLRSMNYLRWTISEGKWPSLRLSHH